MLRPPKSVAAVTRGTWIVAAPHGVGIPDRAASALDTDLASSQIIDDLLGPFLSFSLRWMNGA